MSHTSELIDQLKTARKIDSDYAIAESLGITRAAISSYRRGISHADDRIAVLLADALGVDRFKTIARINADRSKKAEERAFWKRMATAASICLAVYTSIAPERVAAAEGPALSSTIPVRWILCQMVSQAIDRLARVLRSKISLRLNGFSHASTALC